MAQKYEHIDRYRQFTRRSLFVAGSQAALLSVLAGRMYYLQVLESDRYLTLAEDNRINLRLLPPPRGRIVDRFGLLLATNQQNFRAVLVKEQARDVEGTLAKLGRVIQLTEDDIQRVLKQVKRKRAFVPVTVRENLAWEEVAKVEVNGPELPGVWIEVGATRLYPYGAPMSQVLGYVSAVSEAELTGDPLLELPGFRIGKNGIEKKYDLALRGSAGNSQVEVNAYGRVIRELKREEGNPGHELVLTIDGGLQSYTHQRLMSERSAAAVVLDVRNGDVLALSSVPSFDPNAFSLGISGKAWQDLLNDPLHPLTNKAISGTFAPGSTFKMIVALAAMEAGIGAGHRVTCGGYITLGRRRFHCWKRYGHGTLDMYGGIQKSCDLYFYDLAQRLGFDAIGKMARRFGLGAEVGIDLPNERPGVIPSADWKLANIGERWQGGETLVNAIGQGFVLTTPLQLATMAARIASGGKAVKPRLTRGIRAEVGGEPPPEPEFESLEIPERHMKVIHKAMDLVSNHPRGTAYGARIEEEGWELAGKTGTSQVRRISLAERAAGVTKNEQLPWRRRDHALFVAYAPVHKPRYACAVVVEHGGGGSKYAAPIARDILIETQRRDPSARPTVPLMAGGLEADEA
jgi:penicillin-binding protein 2